MKKKAKTFIENNNIETKMLDIVERNVKEKYIANAMNY